jgi:dTDP-4-dehydrorhamnose reductase
MPDQTVLVLGATGQLARALEGAYRGAGAGRITLVGRPQADIVRPSSLRAAIDRVRPSIVINASAYTFVDQAEREEAEAFAVNAEGPASLAALTAASGIPLIHVSTDYVFPGDKPSPYVETDPVDPPGVYGRSKLAGERGVAAENHDHVILRTAWLYSPWGRNFVTTMLRLAEDRDIVRVVSDQRGNPTSASDLADVILGVAAQWQDGGGTPGLFHASASGDASWAEFAEQVFASSRALGAKGAEVEPISSAEYPTEARRPENSRLDCSRLSEAYKMQLPHWRGSVEACIKQIIGGKVATS